MAVADSSIEWTESTWSPVTGCTKVSLGCDHCYAEGIANRFAGTKAFPNGFAVTLRPERMTQPLSWRKPRRIFVNSMSDLFHDEVPDGYIAEVFGVMALAERHTFQLLTKRHGRMRSLLQSAEFASAVVHAAATKARAWGIDVTWAARTTLPLPNVWLGVSVEDQKRADIRIPALLDTPAAVRWLSCEPLLGPVNLDGHLTRPAWGDSHPDPTSRTGLLVQDLTTRRAVDWVVVGGESGHGARPMHPDWARSLRDQCVSAGVPFFFKQHGEWVAESAWLHRNSAPAAFLDAAGNFRPLVNGWPAEAPMARGEAITVRQVGKRTAGRLLDDRTWDEYPAVAR